MSPESPDKNSSQHRYGQTNRNSPQPQRNMERSWRRDDAPAASEMSASAWRSPQNFIKQQDQIRLAEHKAEVERNAASSSSPGVINTKLEIVDRPSRVTPPAAATSTTSLSATTTSDDNTNDNTMTPTKHSSTNEQTHDSKYYIQEQQSKEFISVEDISISDIATSASQNPGLSTDKPMMTKSNDMEPSTGKSDGKNEDNQMPRERKSTKHTNGSWRNFNNDGQPRQRNNSSNNNKNRNRQNNNNKNNSNNNNNRPWRHMHPDDKHSPHVPIFYKYFMDYDSVKTGLENGDLYKCQLRINARKRMDAYATSEVLGEDIYLCGDTARNRALDGDVVVVRLLDVETIWQERTRREKHYAEKRKRQQQQQEQAATIEENDNETATTTTSTNDQYIDNDNDNDNNDTAVSVVTLAEDDTVNAKDNPVEQEVDDNEDGDGDDGESTMRKPKYAGEVVYILDRAEGMTFTGIISTNRPGAFQKKATKDTKRVWFKPSNKRTPLMMIDVRHAPKDVISNAELNDKQLVEVALDRWPISFKAPFGRILRCIGPIGDLKVEEQAMLTDNNIMDSPFNALLMAHLNEIPRTIAAIEVKKRRDLRDELIFTIDPLSAKDLDDALHVKRLDDGNFEVGVHIADVSYYVKQDTLLDAEARKRGTTTYLVNKSIPMLPPQLCEELCSLTPLEDKLAFSVIWKLDQNGNVLDTWFGRTIIRSCAKLAYEDAQNVIEHGHLPEDTVITEHSKQQAETNIEDLFKLSAALRKKRYEDGALSLNSIKLSFTLNDDDEPIGVSVFEAKEANKLVEEFMLMANISVAEKIWEHYPSCSLLRRHECPIERRLNQFLDLTRELGYDFDVGSAAGLQTSFNELDDPEVKTVLQVLAVQPMKRAMYVCSGAARNKQFSHYALNQDYYTHFTSPIRRYADVVVHRLLNAALMGKEDCGYDTKSVQKIVLRCNRKKDGAKNAQEADIMLYLAEYLSILEKTQGTQTAKAVVIGINKKRYDVYVPKYGLEYCILLGGLPLQDSVYQDGRLDLYWKVGIPANAAYFEKVRERKWDDADDDENTKDDGDDDNVNNGTQAVDGDDDENNNNKTNNEVDQITRQLSNANVGTASGDSISSGDGDLPRKLHAAILDNGKYMQSLDILTTIDVNVIPDKSQTPPRIHIFPVNPF